VEASKIIVDTDIVIDYLKKREPGAELLKKVYLKYRINVTSITIYELFYGVQKSGKEGLINKLLIKYVDVITLDESAARNAAAIHYILKSKGIDIGVKDSFIAGICKAHNLPLLTRNIKHFSRIHGLRLLDIE
jgi:tRNA(fMet)-specific endonuclease VapC